MNPDTGEIYEGVLRDETHIALSQNEADLLKQLPESDRMGELANLRKRFETETKKDNGDVEAKPDATAPQPEQPELVRLVIATLQARNYKPKCPQCSAIGWATTYIHPVPVVTQSLTAEVIPSALLVCGKCGAQREHNLNVLGITVQSNEKRVLTPDQIRQERKPLVMS